MGSKFTAKKVESVVREGAPGRYSDGGGLYLMIPPSGAAYWMLRYTLHGKRRELTLGKQQHMSLAEARSEAEEKKKALRSGTDPIAEKKREKDVKIRCVDDLFVDWYQTLERRIRCPQIPKRIYSKEIGPYIGRHALTAVKPMDVRQAVRRIADSGRPSIANDALMYLKQLFNHGIKLGVLTYNPAAAFDVNDAGGVEKSRDRVLSTDEIALAFKIFSEQRDSFIRENYLACALLLVLGVRKTELTEAKWSEFDLANGLWQLPDERSKSGQGLTIPLPPQVIKWLQELQMRACGSPFVFPNRRTSKTPHMGKDTLNRAIAKQFGIEPGKTKQPPNRMGTMEPFTVHDLRRSCRSLMASLGVPGHVAERCLNHKLKGVEAVYNHYDYLAERRAAHELVAKQIDPMVI